MHALNPFSFNNRFTLSTNIGNYFYYKLWKKNRKPDKNCCHCNWIAEFIFTLCIKPLQPATCDHRRFFFHLNCQRIGRMGYVKWTEVININFTHTLMYAGDSFWKMNNFRSCSSSLVGAKSFFSSKNIDKT